MERTRGFGPGGTPPPPPDSPSQSEITGTLTAAGRRRAGTTTSCDVRHWEAVGEAVVAGASPVAPRPAAPAPRPVWAALRRTPALPCGPFNFPASRLHARLGGHTHRRGVRKRKSKHESRVTSHDTRDDLIVDSRHTSLTGTMLHTAHAASHMP